MEVLVCKNISVQVLVHIFWKNLIDWKLRNSNRFAFSDISIEEIGPEDVIVDKVEDAEVLIPEEPETVEEKVEEKVVEKVEDKVEEVKVNI